MNDLEILEYMEENYVNMLFKDDKNKEKFLNFLEQKGKLGFNKIVKDFVGKRHISFFYSDFTSSDYCLSGTYPLDGFEDCYYEDLFNNYKVELI